MAIGAFPYRRGYLLYGPPGTGKSSLSFAVAGYFKLKIYIVSLNSSAMNEENLGTLFADLPKKCVVLLEDIDTAGLTHTRQAPEKDPEEDQSLPPQPQLLRQRRMLHRLLSIGFRSRLFSMSLMEWLLKKVGF